MRKLAMTTAALIAALATQADAAVFTSRAAFNAATSGLSIVDFNNTAGPSDIEVYQGLSYLNSGVTFSTASGQMFTEGLANGFAAGPYYGSDYLLWQNANPNTLTITLPSTVTAIAFDFAELRGGALVPGDVYTIQIGASSYIANTIDGGAAFFGVTEMAGFSQLTITDQNDTLFVFPTIDNFTFGSAGAAVVPEPASLALLGTGLLGAFFAGRRRQNVSVKI